MTIPRNLSILAEGASSSGVLATTNGGTALTSFTSGGAVYATSTYATWTVTGTRYGTVGQLGRKTLIFCISIYRIINGEIHENCCICNQQKRRKARKTVL